MIKQSWHAIVLLVAACSAGPAAGPVTPSSTSAVAAVESFMQAVADSNLPRLATLWGTAAGPAAKTGQPTDWERRVAVMQTYLRNESHRVLPFSPADGARQDVQVEIRRDLCTWVVPFTAIRLGDGSWLVNQVDLTKAGNPARPCGPGGPTGRATEDTTAAE
ncbi:MAG TPA: hypothetical protein VMN37_12475 [Gemmatimonadales bacterium]|nr:hypothetical protein [Gemmatimonadales bacterium]